MNHKIKSSSTILFFILVSASITSTVFLLFFRPVLASPGEEMETAESLLYIDHFTGNSRMADSEETYLLYRLKTVPGIPEAELNLPKEAGVILTDGSYQSIPVSWHSDNYHSTAEGSYQFYMEINSAYQYDRPLPYAEVVINPAYERSVE